MFSVEKNIVDSGAVSYYMIDDGKIGYIRVDNFVNDVAERFKKALDSLEKSGFDRLIIDVRDNPGGSEEFIKMADMLCPEGKIIEFIRRYKNKNYYSDSNCINKPMVVLVNGNTGSSSELFTSALQELGGAAVVGTTTYGKACGQNIHILPDGSAIGITAEKALTTNGNDFHGIGITPDYEVKQPVGIDEDLQLQKAIEIINTL